MGVARPSGGVMAAPPSSILSSRAQVKASLVGGVEHLRLWREDERPPRIRVRRTESAVVVA